MDAQKPLEISRDEFLWSTAESGLSGISELVAQSGDSNSGIDMARKLVADQRLTAYQAAAVLERRFGDLRMGNYDILDKIGAGGMGAVYKARHRRMKRVVALKVLGATTIAGKPDLARRFQREIEAIALLKHPNIVMAYDADEAEQGPFLVMEFIDGWDLAREIIHDGPLTLADAIDCVIQTAHGLAYAHEAGIVHRDVKPANIIRSADGVIKITDLGIARFNGWEPGEGAITQAGSVVGTVEYMAPEQAVAAGQIDHRADVYGLGCTLYFLLTGKTPFLSASAMGMMLQHRDAPIPSLSEARAAVPSDLDAIFRLMIAKDPVERFQTMTEVIQILEALLQTNLPTDSAVAASPPPNAPAQNLYKTLTSGLRWLTKSDSGKSELKQTPSPTEVIYGLSVVLVEPSRTQAAIIRRRLLRNWESGRFILASRGMKGSTRRRSNFPSTWSFRP